MWLVSFDVRKVNFLYLVLFGSTLVLLANINVDIFFFGAKLAFKILGFFSLLNRIGVLMLFLLLTKLLSLRKLED